MDLQLPAPPSAFDASADSYVGRLDSGYRRIEELSGELMGELEQWGEGIDTGLISFLQERGVAVESEPTAQVKVPGRSESLFGIEADLDEARRIEDLLTEYDERVAGRKHEFLRDARAIARRGEDYSRALQDLTEVNAVVSGEAELGTAHLVYSREGTLHIDRVSMEGVRSQITEMPYEGDLSAESFEEVGISGQIYVATNPSTVFPANVILEAAAERFVDDYFLTRLETEDPGVILADTLGMMVERFRRVVQEASEGGEAHE